MHDCFDIHCDCKFCRREREKDELRTRIKDAVGELDLGELQAVHSVVALASRPSEHEPDYEEKEVPF